jgi:hypothetical protein
MPSSRQPPYLIQGSVTVNGSAYRGAKVWVIDLTSSGRVSAPIEGITYYTTDDSGAFLIDLADSDDNYADQDKIRVLCQTETGIISSYDIVVDITSGRNTVSFVITTNSAFVDGLKSSSLSNRKGGLGKGGMQVGLPSYKDNTLLGLT